MGVANDNSEHSLFEFAGIPLPVHRPLGGAGQIHEFMRASGKRALIVVGAAKDRPVLSLSGAEEIQFELGLDSPKHRRGKGRPVHVLPRTKSTYLNCTVSAFFSNDQVLFNRSEKLWDDGVEYLGDLVQMVPDHVQRYLKQDKAAFHRMEVELAVVGLRFGCEVPFWKRPRRFRLS